MTADTLLADNPRLTARDAEGEHAPVRFVLDRRFRSAGRAGLNLFTDAFRGRTIVVGLAAGARAADLAWYEAEGVTVWALPGEEADFLDAWAERCATEGLTGVLIEAGPRFASALLREGGGRLPVRLCLPAAGRRPREPDLVRGGGLPPDGRQDHAFRSGRPFPRLSRVGQPRGGGRLLGPKRAANRPFRCPRVRRGGRLSLLARLFKKILHISESASPCPAGRL